MAIKEFFLPQNTDSMMTACALQILKDDHISMSHSSDYEFSRPSQ